RRRWAMAAVALVAFASGAAFMMLTGPRDLPRYPDAAQSPYRLPWRGGITRLCCQGNRAVVSHRGFEEYAYDFAMPVGSDVCAARAGVITYVQVNHDGRGPSAPNNMVTIQH